MSLLQISFSCVQNETADVHTLLLQRPEQHWVFSVQPLPEVRQVPPGFTGAHLPAVHLPLQH